MFGLKKAIARRAAKARKGIEQVDVLEVQYRALIKDYGGLVADLAKLRFRKAQLRKQLDNLEAYLEKQNAESL